MGWVVSSPPTGSVFLITKSSPYSTPRLLKWRQKWEARLPRGAPEKPEHLDRALNSGMSGVFSMRFYRLKDSVMCDRSGAMAADSGLVYTATLEEAQEFSRKFVAQCPTLGCLVYRPDGSFAEQIPGSHSGDKPRPTRWRFWLLACAQLLPAAALFWWDAANGFGLIIPSLLATRLVYGGLFKVAEGIAGQDDRGA